MKNNMEILCGISCSGKSTYAHSRWLQDPLGTIVVNRDKIRESLFGFTEGNVEYYYHHKDFGKLEQLVSKQEEAMVRFALGNGLDVVLDATHLKYSYVEKWNKFSESFNIIIKYFDISLEEALRRNAKRERKVLENVVRDQYERYKKLRNEKDGS